VEAGGTTLLPVAAKAPAVTLVIVPDALFAEPRLARIYDLWEGDRVDLPHYLAIAAELGARSVLDVGCGTGNWACMLAERGFEVVALDPAGASLDVARVKPGAQRVRWIHGDVMSLPALAVDLATMTGNVSNVFLTQQEWLATLAGAEPADDAGISRLGREARGVIEMARKITLRRMFSRPEL